MLGSAAKASTAWFSISKRSAAAVAASASAGWHHSSTPSTVVYHGMMPSPSGSRITTASLLPMPFANPSIQAVYSATLVAPPAEYWAQSRNGRL